MKIEIINDVIEAISFLEEAGFPVSGDIYDGYISLKDAVLQVLDSSNIEYGIDIDNIINDALLMMHIKS